MSGIDPSNVFECSQRMIQKIEDRDDLVEALLWATVISVYQNEVARLTQQIADIRSYHVKELERFR